MDKCATIAQLLYQLAINEKCKVPYRFSIRYRRNLKNTIILMEKLLNCLIDAQCVTLPEPLCTFIEQNAGKKLPISSSVFQSWKAQGFKFEISQIIAPEDRLICMMRSLLHSILLELETRKRGYTQRVFWFIHDFHNLPRPFMDKEKKTLWAIELPPISVDEAIGYCSFQLGK